MKDGSVSKKNGEFVTGSNQQGVDNENPAGLPASVAIPSASPLKATDNSAKYKNDLHKYRRDFNKESAGMVLGEVTSQVVSAGVFGVSELIAPKLVKSASKVMSDNVITPNLEFIERTLNKACKLKGSLPDMSEARHVRVENWGRLFVLFGASWVAAMLAKLAIRQVSNEKFSVKHEEPPNGNWFHDKVLYRNMSKHDWKILVADEGVHLGSLVVMNTAMAKHTDSTINVATKIIKGLGCQPQKAREMAGYLTVWELPNLFGLLAGLGVIGHHYSKKAKDSHVKSLMNNTTSPDTDLPSRA